MPFWPILSIPNYFWMLLIALTPCTIPKKSKYSIILSWNVKKLELKWTKLFKNNNFQRFFMLLWRLFMGFLKIGSQNYFKIKFFLLTNTYILICMWRNVRFKKFDLCLSWGYMCIVSPWLSGWWCPKMSKIVVYCKFQVHYNIRIFKNHSNDNLGPHVLW